jgi:hypothetical protein
MSFWPVFFITIYVCVSVFLATAAVRVQVRWEKGNGRSISNSSAFFAWITLVVLWPVVSCILGWMTLLGAFD